MKRLRLSPLLFRRIHKWVGLALGLQFVLWTLSGAVMALLPAHAVGGHGDGGNHAHALAAGPYIDPARLTAGQPVHGLVLRDLGGRPVYEIREASGIRLADATTGAPVSVDRATAIAVARMTSDAPVASVWPEVAAAGKGAISVAQLCSHFGGLPGITVPFALGRFDTRYWKVRVPAVVRSTSCRRSPMPCRRWNS